MSSSSTTKPNLRRILQAQLTRDGYDVLTAEDGEQGLHLLGEHHIDLIVTDLKMPKIDGMQLLREALREQPDLPVVMITAHGTVDTAVEALKLGAFDYLTKPFDKDDVRQVVAKALKTRQLSQADAGATTSASDARFGIIGSTSSLGDLYAVLERVADHADDRAHHRRERHRQGAGARARCTTTRRARTSRSSR